MLSMSTPDCVEGGGLWVADKIRLDGQERSLTTAPFSFSRAHARTVVRADGLGDVGDKGDLHVAEAPALARGADPRQVGLLRVGRDADHLSVGRVCFDESGRKNEWRQGGGPRGGMG